MKTLGVLGGMGPLATVDFLSKLIKLTAAKKDNDHIHTLIDNNCNIPDRTDYILRNGVSPLSELLLSAKRLEGMGADILVMPCNTAHYFGKEIEKEIEIPFINMIEETAKSIDFVTSDKKVGLLASKGTYRSKIYNKIFDRYNIHIIEPPLDFKLKINDIIYRIKGGMCDDLATCRGELEEVIDYFKDLGVERLILGCTELPLLFNNHSIKGIDFIDPTEILAICVIGKMNKRICKKK